MYAPPDTLNRLRLSTFGIASGRYRLLCEHARDSDDAGSTCQSLTEIIFVYENYSFSYLLPISRGSTLAKPGRYWLARSTRLRRNIKRRPPTSPFFNIYGGTPPTTPPLTSVLPTPPSSLAPRSSHHPPPSLTPSPHNKMILPPPPSLRLQHKRSQTDMVMLKLFVTPEPSEERCSCWCCCYIARFASTLFSNSCETVALAAFHL